MSVSVKIDYLQYAVGAWALPDVAGHKELKPMNNYQNVTLDEETGAIVLKENTNKKARPQVILSGKALDSFREFIAIDEHIKQILKQGATVSRLDIAVDMTGDDIITHDKMIAWYHKGKITSAHLEHNGEKLEPQFIGHVTQNKNRIESLYFGSWEHRAKKGIVRMYDKSLDLGGYAGEIIRFEIEEKRKKAQSSAKRIAEGDSLQSVLRSRFDVNDEKWVGVMGKDVSDITRGEQIEYKEKADTWDWLKTTVVKVLARKILEDAIDSRTDNLQAFNMLLELEYTRLAEELTKDINLE